MKRHYKVMEIICLFVFPLVFFSSVIVGTRFLSFRADTDYDATLPVWQFVADEFYRTGTFPSWNPYVGKGITVVSDPLSMIFNPFFAIPLLIFGANWGVRIVIIAVGCVSALSMWVFLTRFGISSSQKILWSWLYVVSGSFVAHVTSGHISELLIFPLVPLFFASTLIPNFGYKGSLVAAVMLSLIIFSGQLYTFLFVTFLFIAVRIVYIARGEESLKRILPSIICLYGIFLLITAVKLIPMFRDVYPNMARYFPINPYAGSLHLAYFFLPFIVPYDVAFYDRPLFQRLFGFRYNWYEYYTFISPLPFIFLINFVRFIKRSRNIQILAVSIATGALYVSIGYWYSPFHWLFEIAKPLQSVRVPQRMYMVLMPLMIGLLAVLCTKFKYKKTAVVILVVTLVWVSQTTRPLLFHAFEPTRVEHLSLAHTLRSLDQSEYYVVSFVCCIQNALYKEKIPILNYYYGWRFEGDPNFLSEDGTEYNYDMLFRVRPTYAISRRDVNLSRYGYHVLFSSESMILWRTDSPNTFPSKS